MDLKLMKLISGPERTAKNIFHFQSGNKKHFEKVQILKFRNSNILISSNGIRQIFNHNIAGSASAN